MSVHAFPVNRARAASVGVAAALALSLAAPFASAAPAPESFAPLAKRVSPAVVNIQVLKEMAAARPEGTPNLPQGTPFDEFFKRYAPQPKGPRQVAGLGSGFVIDESGYVVTNNHVAADAKEIRVVLQDGRKLEGKLVGRDEKTDLALIKVESDTKLPSVGWGDSAKSEVGDWVMAVGNPFGLGGTVTAGIISARARDIQAGPYDDFIQTDAAINQGNSGGPLFNVAGEVIGVNTAIYSPTGGSVGIGFAIPAALAKPVIEQLKASGRVERGWIGVSVQTLTPEIAFGLGLKPETDGALVAQIDPEGPAAKSGLRQGDVIVAVGEHRVNALRDLPKLVAGVKPGERVTLSVLRRSAELSVPVTVAAAPEAKRVAEEGAARPDAQRRPPASSAVGLALSPQPAGAQTPGVLVSEVRDGSAADDAGLEAGDVIVQVSGDEVRRPADVERQLVAARGAKHASVVMLVSRRGNEQFVAMKLPASAA